MRVYLTRHGLTEWNVEKRMHGHKNANLTQQGIEGAKKLGQSIEHIKFDCIYSSPSPRALDTAKYIRGNKDTQIITTEYLKEINFGKWEGMLEVDAEKYNPEQFYNIWNKPELFNPVEGGEKIEDLIERVKTWFYSILESQQYENVLIVTHGVVKRAFYTFLKENKIENFWDEPHISNTSLTIIDIKDDKIEFVLEADTSHLE
ncbi:MAG: histidine phosphatase family protein [Paraclostridium sp.]